MLIQITRKCNEKCTHCMVNATPGGEHMSESTFIKCVQFAIDNDVKVINISGGDPFLHPEIFKLLGYLFREIRNKKFFVSIESNGWWITDNYMCERIKKLCETYQQLAYIQVSTHEKYYPNYELIMSHKNDFGKISNKVKLIANWQDENKSLVRLGRAVNLIGKDEVKGFPNCLNYVNVALAHRYLKIMNLKQLINYMVRERIKTCVPYINVYGGIQMGEGYECVRLANINEYVNRNKFNNELFKSIIEFSPCNKCLRLKNIPIQSQIQLNKLRNENKLTPIF